MNRKNRRNLLLGLGFIGPNILGFLAFTLIPLVFSFIMAFTNWDLRQHNMFKPAPIKFVGFDHFVRLLTQPDFTRFLGNTLFFMIGIPFSIGGSLLLAMMLSKDLRGGNRRVFGILIASMVLVVSIVMLTSVGAGATGMTILLTGLACAILLTGVLGGNSVYRTLFYLPSFTSGVAVFILWKKLYSPYTGPINSFLAEPLRAFGESIKSVPAATIESGFWIMLGVLTLLLAFGLRRICLMWRDGDLGWLAAIFPVLFILTPVAMALYWSPSRAAAYILLVVGACLLLWQLLQARTGQGFPCRKSSGFGSAAVFALMVMTGEFVVLGLGLVLYHLPVMAAGGLEPPEWLTNYYWAKPAIMIMGFWGAIGSNNMLLYLAGLSNVPTELYEAADIDGASPFQKFWNVTWPQLAPVTFFIVVMSVIGGLQGGFEMARTMTQGGPAGSTTTLSYFIYNEGFDTGRLGYASAIAWFLFAMVFIVTMFNWKFGSKYVND